MRIQAAVMRDQSGHFDLAELDLEEPQADELLVRVVASGICHTDLAMFERPAMPRPMVLGHEGAGVVERVGANVSAVQLGDHVLLSYDACGRCSLCASGHPAYCRDARPLNFSGSRPDGTSALSEDGSMMNGHFFGQSSFASHAIVTERNIVKVDPALPLDLLAPLGCGIQTGTGAVLNVLAPAPGSSIAIFGAGSVGLSALLAAKVARCETIVAVDIKQSRLDAALELGASHVIDATSTEDVAAELRRIMSGHGVQYAFSSTGNPESLRQAIEGLDSMGTAAFVSGGTDASIPTSTLLWGRTLKGVVQGDAVPQSFLPRLIDLWQRGEFPFDRLITHYDFADINVASQASLSGEIIKPVLRFT
ncbi:MAG: NAD(P)-dependent alcohol dehydrogenase [Dehalococcoidia bacterium]